MSVSSIPPVSVGTGKYLWGQTEEKSQPASDKPSSPATKDGCSGLGCLAAAIIDFFAPPDPPAEEDSNFGCGNNQFPEETPDGEDASTDNVIPITDVSVPCEDGIDADGGACEGITIEEGGTVYIDERVIDTTASGTRLQELGTVTTVPISFLFSHPVSRIRIEVESVDLYANPELAGLDGMIDTATIADGPNAYNVGTEEAPLYIPDPRDPNNRIPVYLGSLTLHDLSGRILDDREAPVCGETTPCTDDHRILAAGASGVLTVDLTDPDLNLSDFYADSRGSFQISLTLRADITNVVEEHQYGIRLRVRLVIE